MKTEENAEQKLNLMIRWRPLDFLPPSLYVQKRSLNLLKNSKTSVLCAKSGLKEEKRSEEKNKFSWQLSQTISYVCNIIIYEFMDVIYCR